MSIRQTVFAGVLASLTFAGVLLAAHVERSFPAPGEPTIAEMRQATDRFRNVRVALAEGSAIRTICVRRQR